MCVCISILSVNQIGTEMAASVVLMLTYDRPLKWTEKTITKLQFESYFSSRLGYTHTHIYIYIYIYNVFLNAWYIHEV